MTVFIPSVNVAKVALEWSGPEGDTAVNTHHVLNSGAWDAAGLTALANAVISWYTTATLGVTPKQLVRSGYKLAQVRARDLTTQTSPEVAVSPAGGPIDGTDVSAAVSSGLTIAIKQTTGLTGRSNRGRTFWPSLAADQLQADPNFVSTGAGAQFVTAIANLVSAIHAANVAWQMVILSQYSGVDVNGKPLPRAAGVTNVINQVGLTDSNVDFQRRRAPGHSVHR